MHRRALLFVCFSACAACISSTLEKDAADTTNNDNNGTTAVTEVNGSSPVDVTTEDPASFVDYVADNVSTTPSPGDPSSCEGLCPPYRLEDVRPSYEVRAYPAAYWLSTVVFAENRVLAELEGFEKLREYLEGKNENGLTMNTTVPLVTQIKHQADVWGRKEPKDYTVSLYLPLENRSEPPYPLTNDILIDSSEQRLVFVQKFQAHLWQVSDRNVRARATKMIATLQENGEAFLGKYVYLATYNRAEFYDQSSYEMWVFASRFRDSSLVRPRLRPVDPPMSKITARTQKRICRGLECPHFDVLRSYKYGIQKRRYYDIKFASYALDDCRFSQVGLWKGFMPLHLYKHGVNSHLEMIESTRPIGVVHVKELERNDSNCAYNFTVSFYLPERLHANPPTTGPRGPRIRIATIDDLIVFVEPVGGYILSAPERIPGQVQAFSERLRCFQVCFYDDQYYVIVYDFITRFHGRLNEIWLVAKSCNGDEKT